MNFFFVQGNIAHLVTKKKISSAVLKYIYGICARLTIFSIQIAFFMSFPTSIFRMINLRSIFGMNMLQNARYTNIFFIESVLYFLPIVEIHLFFKWAIFRDWTFILHSWIISICLISISFVSPLSLLIQFLNRSIFISPFCKRSSFWISLEMHNVDFCFHSRVWIWFNLPKIPFNLNFCKCSFFESILFVNISRVLSNSDGLPISRSRFCLIRSNMPF